jgi:SNF2 family DNA or RNA helicase
MAEQLAERLELETAPLEQNIEFDLNPQPAEEWSEGVEHLREKTPEDLYSFLGLDKHTIPFFRENIAVERDVSHKLGDLETSATTTEGFSLRWHQLVGTVRMLERAKTSEPVLLMDDVGLGKTVQVLASFAMLAFYRIYYQKNKTYPGLWGKFPHV